MCCPESSPGLNRLIAAALVDHEFCQRLLTTPNVTIKMNYRGEPFRLTSEDRQLVLSIEATSLTDFATQIYVSIRGEAR